MIGQNGEVISGVMYSNDRSTKIQTAPGHGELIVNSKGNFDNYYVTKEDIIYSEISVKNFRLEPEVVIEEKKVKLKVKKNNQKQKYESSLGEEAILYLHHLANFIEQTYNMRMDIEFVYDPKKNIINLVQARPIPLGARKNLIASAISPELIGKINKEGKILNGQAITTELNRAVIIKTAEELIISTTIDQALVEYLKSEKDIKAVIIEREAPDTSHEAGEFTSIAIPVIQIDDIEKARELLNHDKLIIVDIQRKKIVQLPDDLAPAKTEDELYASEILKEGIFRSSLSPHVTISIYQFAEGSYKHVKNIKYKSLGKILKKAKSGDHTASEQLFSYLFDIIGNKQIKKSYTMNEILIDLENLSTPEFNKSNNEVKSSLTNILQFVINSKKKSLISSDIFRQIMIIAGELYLEIENIETSKINDKQLIDYLNIYEKFLGIVTSNSKKNVLSDSLFMQIKRKIQESETSELVKNLNLSEVQKNNLLLASSLKKFLINNETKNNWQKFCIDICKTTNSQEFGAFIVDILKNNIHENWLNVSFNEAYKENDGNSNRCFLSLIEEYNIALSNFGIFENITQKINILEAQIHLWNDPQKFTELYDTWQRYIKEINNNLKYDNTDPKLKQILILEQINSLTEVMDRVIKSLQISSIYADKELQVERFKILIGDMYELMKIWTEYATFHYRDDIILQLDNFIKNKSSSTDKKELALSGEFSVYSVTMDRPGLFPNGFGRGFRCKSFADFHTLVHQNLLVSISKLTNNNTKSLKEYYPQLLQNINKEFIIISSFLSQNFNYPFINLHYNIPLRDHSAKIEVKYNYVNNKANISFMMFGENESARWDLVELNCYALLEISLIKIIKTPYHNRNQKSVYFEVEINHNEKISHLASIIKAASETSMINAPKNSIINSNIDQLKIVSIEKIKAMIEYFRKIYHDFNDYQKEWLKEQLYTLEYIVYSKQENFDINKYISELPKIFNDYNFIELFDEIIKNNKLNYNFRQSENSFSLMELYLIGNTEELADFDIKTVNCNEKNFMISLLLRVITKQVKSKFSFQDEIEKCVEIISALLKNGCKFYLENSEDWKFISQLVEIPIYESKLLEIINPRTCDIETLYEILSVELNSRCKISKEKSKIHTEFARKLVKPYGIDIDLYRELTSIKNSIFDDQEIENKSGPQAYN